MDPKFKILVVGDVRGNFKQLFQRVENINKKSGPFEILLCVGDFFSEDDKQNEELIAYKNGHKNTTLEVERVLSGMNQGELITGGVINAAECSSKFCVPTYILGPNKSNLVKYYEHIKDGEICSNLTYLGKRGLYTLTNGTKIAYLSGKEKPSDGPNEVYYFQIEDIDSVRNSSLVNKSISSDYRGIDILLTSQWPTGISEDNTNDSKLISLLCRDLKPRYHFCGLKNNHFEPPPYRFPSDETTQLELCTRFISLAEVGNLNKVKYIYALSLTPVEKMRVVDLIQKTTNEIPCPFANINFSDFKTIVSNSENKQFFFDMSSKHSEANGKRSGGGQDSRNKRTKIAHWDQDICWFCLSCPSVEKHLIISIGEHFYLALAKGPINDYHILILSITHIPCAAQLTDGDWKELIKFKTALTEFFKDQNQVVCFTERNYKSSHLQINVFSVDEGYGWKIPHAFEDKAEEFNLQFEKISDLKRDIPKQGPYFVAELPNDTTLITRQMNHFPIHFARDVFCSENLLNCDEKVDWKSCKLDKEHEIELVENFRSKFSKYDFTC